MSLACTRAHTGHNHRVVPRSRSAIHARASTVDTRWSRCRLQRTHVTAISSATGRKYAYVDHLRQPRYTVVALSWKTSSRLPT
jgi:hypothetical protein